MLDPQDAHPSPRALNDQGNVTAITRDEGGGTTLWSVRDVPQVRAVFAEKKTWYVLRQKQDKNGFTGKKWLILFGKNG